MDIVGLRLVYVYVKVEAATFFNPRVMPKNKIKILRVQKKWNAPNHPKPLNKVEDPLVHIVVKNIINP